MRATPPRNKDGPTDSNLVVAATLQEIVALVRLTSGDKFRSRAYSRAAESVSAIGNNLSRLVEQNRLTELRGVGPSLAKVIEEIVRTGKSRLLERLRVDLPSGALALSRIHGLNLDKIRKLHDELGVSSVEELRAAIEAGSLRRVSGFGARTEAALLKQLSTQEKADDRMLLVNALRIGEGIIDYMRASPKLVNIDQAGSPRRWKETTSEVRITASGAGDSAELMSHFLSYPMIVDVEDQKKTSARVRLIEGARVTLKVAAKRTYWNLLHHETGSKAHLKRLETIAAKKGIQLTPRRMVRKGETLIVGSESDIYQQLGMQYVPPELREDQGEVEQARSHALPSDLITAEDIKGSIHCHTTYSDGRNTVEEMAARAQAMGMQYITITDHSPTAHYAGGLKLDRLKRQWDEIDRVQEKLSIKLLRGTESDILRDGSLDYPDSILEKFDVIIASIHQRYKLEEDEMTKRVVNAMKNPLFKIWGHPSGRLVLRRPPIPARMEDILDVIAESGAAIEISGDPYRLDMSPTWAKEARKRHIKFVISTDAHSVRDLKNIRFGIGLARRASVTRGEVLNTLSVAAFKQAVKPS